MNRLITRPRTSERQVRVEHADTEWFTWLRTRTPILGHRQGQLIALRPGGRKARMSLLAIACAVAATASAGLSTIAWLAGASAALLTIGFACTAPWVPQQRRYAHDLAAGDLIRMPRRPWTAGIVTKADTYDGLTYVDIFGDHALVYEANREVARVYLDGPLAHKWIYGRVQARDITPYAKPKASSWPRR